jgi:hypothetical protein
MKTSKKPQEEENIFNAVAPDFEASPKQKLHKSKHPGNLPPTGSTFGLITTSAKVRKYNVRLPICPEVSMRLSWDTIRTLLTSTSDLR